MVCNCGHTKNKQLIPKYIEEASGLDLHRFNWLKDNEIDRLDIRWNWLVGDYINLPQGIKIFIGRLVGHTLRSIKMLPLAQSGLKCLN